MLTPSRAFPALLLSSAPDGSHYLTILVFIVEIGNGLLVRVTALYFRKKCVTPTPQESPKVGRKQGRDPRRALLIS